MTIGELSRATAIPPSMIRFYEEQGLIPPPRRVSGRRVFDDEAVPHLAFVQVAKAPASLSRSVAASCATFA
jgi:DNA-binding transcriptional MerR regulator